MQKEHLLPRGALLRLHFGAAGRAALAQAAALGCGFAASGTRLFGVMTPLGLALALGVESPYFAAAAAGAAMGLLARPGADTVALLCALAAALAVLAFLLMPQRWVLAVPAADPAESGGRPAVSAAATRLSAVAESLAGIAETVNGVYEALPKRGETYNWVVQRVQDELCAACARREDCWQAGYSDSVSGMFALKPRLEQTGRVEIEDLPAAFSRCIHPTALCGAAGRAWAQYCARRTARVQADALRAALTEQYDAVAAALAALAGQLGAPGLPEPYQTGRVAALFASLGMEPLECAVTLDALGRTQCAVTLPRRSLSEAELAALAGEVGRLCRRPMDPPQKLSCREATTLLFSEKPALRPVFGAAGLPASGAVSGDAVQQFCVPGAADMLLCDGMGTGCPAAVDGNLAAELTARLLRAGFAPDTAARLVNVALSLKSEDESGATLDLVQVDLFTGAARLFKAGAAPGFAVLGGKAAVLGGQGLPVGILPKVEARTQSFRLCPGDWVVLVSDGMLVDGPDWILQQLELSAAAGAAPDALAQLLVKTARMRAERAGRPDDITAAVLRLEKAV